MTARGVFNALVPAAGDLARPFALYATAASCGAALCMGVGADRLTVAFGALTLMYGAKATEQAVIARANAKAQASAGAPP